MSEKWRVGVRQARYAVADEGARAKLKGLGIPCEFDALSVGSDQRQVAIIPLDNADVKDAALISAAPEMLEALKMLLVCVTDRPSAEDPVNRRYDVSAITLARDALAKAEGYVK